MLLNRSTVLGAVVVGLAMAAQASAGTTFRLEVGSAIAGGTGTKVKNAVVMVRALACDDDRSVRVTGVAEGMVKDGRRSIPLELVLLPTPGVYAVTQQWPDGVWIVNLTAVCPGRNATASALVPLDGKTGFVRDKTQLFDRAATARRVPRPRVTEALMIGSQRRSRSKGETSCSSSQRRTRSHKHSSERDSERIYRPYPLTVARLPIQ
jgi:hypothetical protein